MKRITLVGDPIIDSYLYCSPKGLSPEAPIISWAVDKVEERPGGAGNVWMNLLALTRNDPSVEVIFLAEVDQRFIDAIPKHALYTDSMKMARWNLSVKNRIIFESPHQQIIRFDQDCNLGPTDEGEDYIIQKLQELDSDICVISDYAHGGVTQDIITAAKESCETLIVDPKGTCYRKYSGANIITPNLQEMKDMLGTSWTTSPKENARMLSVLLNKQAPQVVLHKLGGDGCILHQPTSTEHIPAFRTAKPVIDPTGAGDTFIATLAARLAQGCDMRTAASAANRMAGESVTHPNCWAPWGSDETNWDDNSSGC